MRKPVRLLLAVLVSAASCGWLLPLRSAIAAYLRTLEQCVSSLEAGRKVPLNSAGLFFAADTLAGIAALWLALVIAGWCTVAVLRLTWHEGCR